MKKVTKEIITKSFGENVSNLVMSVTEDKNGESWDIIKAHALEHIDSFSNDSVFLKSADLISNVSEIIYDYNKDGDKIFDRFHESKEKTVKVYMNSMKAILKKWQENPLRNDIENLIELFKTI